jgi:hypothetical protein
MPSRAEVIESLAPKYLWWELDDVGEARTLRILAQIMNFGTYDDIRAIEAAFESEELIAVMARAQPGWFSPRSWDFWRGRLALSGNQLIPARPPKRSFGAEPLQARA